MYVFWTQCQESILHCIRTATDAIKQPQPEVSVIECKRRINESASCSISFLTASSMLHKLTIKRYGCLLILIWREILSCRFHIHDRTFESLQFRKILTVNYLIFE